MVALAALVLLHRAGVGLHRRRVGRKKGQKPARLFWDL